VFDFFGYLENFEDVKFSLHYTTISKSLNYFLLLLCEAGLRILVKDTKFARQIQSAQIVFFAKLSVLATVALYNIYAVGIKR
jgi:hypothetical protein